MQYIDLSVIVGVVIVFMIALIARKVWPLVEAILPPALMLIIKWFAETAVIAIESEYGGGNGAETRQAAFSRIMNMIQPLVSYLEERGFTLDVERVYDAIEAAWNKMNTEQIKAGTKNSEVTE